MLVLDANILIRAVLGSRVLSLLQKYTDEVEFVAPDAGFSEARKHLPRISKRHQPQPTVDPLEVLDLVAELVEVIAYDVYSKQEDVARQRIERRDEKDWPILATALALGCPIWTEDKDFFGCGVATWTTDRIELYLNEITRK